MITATMNKNAKITISTLKLNCFFMNFSAKWDMINHAIVEEYKENTNIDHSTLIYDIPSGVESKLNKQILYICAQVIPCIRYGISVVCHLSLEPAHGGVGDIDDQPGDETQGEDEQNTGEPSDGSILLGNKHIVSGLHSCLPEAVFLFLCGNGALEILYIGILGIVLQDQRFPIRLIAHCGCDFLEQFQGRLRLALKGTEDGGLRHIAGIGYVLVAQLLSDAEGIQLLNELIGRHFGNVH